MNEELQQEFISFLTEALEATDEKDLENKIKKLKKEDLEKYYQAFTEYKQKKDKQKKIKAAHGAKLNYIKVLKNKCDEDEELYYYKKGGIVGCGCRKKEDGGKVQPKKQPKQDQATKDSIAVNVHNDQEIQTSRPGSYKKNKSGKIQWTPDRTKAPYNKKIEKKFCGSKIKKHQQGSELEYINYTPSKYIWEQPYYKHGGSLNSKLISVMDKRRQEKQDEVTSDKNKAKFTNKNISWKNKFLSK